MQKEALKLISASLVKDHTVQAVFVKGSIGRGEDDEYSDIDLYCLVDDEDEKEFLANRLKHLEAYRKVLFHEDLFIIAPQIIAVYDNLLHVDLFTVTEKTFKEKDYFKVIYDPYGLLEKFQASQNLFLTQEEFDSHAYDVAWFLFQYRKAVQRDNDLWAVEMLRFLMPNLAKVLLHRYSPEHAQLGIKTLSKFLSGEKLNHINTIYNYVTPSLHKEAAAGIREAY
ncbi:nucleotidyltransferase domain-containing protein [Evansella sp. LMS18]|uniref:nucleotidyltransferase domain-containing protein n=1 Tax=Evansella sp. LMS18 TaxID=2924033 RepID=UPI0020D0C9CA|nr:nucleotidyltransferase domain-containing protein [Evansella sp. LMS18]UTR10744.1 nucleotidyltransferase domain-containing protein [Evansella sp. LMS18]